MSKYISVEELQKFCNNQKDHSITPNDFQRMNHLEIVCCKDCQHEANMHKCSVMKIEIEISEEDYKRIESTVMTIEEMHETLDGRLYRAIVNGYRKCIKELERLAVLF